MNKKIGIVGPTKNFSELLRVHHKNNEPIRQVQVSSISIFREEIANFDILICILPIAQWTQEYNPVLLEYASHGGMLILLSRQGGDKFNNTFHSSLLEEVSDRNDLLVSEYSRELYQPLLDIGWKHGNSSFQGQILYDGGCSYDVDHSFLATQKGFSVQPNSLSVIGLHRFQGHQMLANRRYQANYYWQKEEPAGAILTHVPMGEGSITFWGGRWTFSDANLFQADNLRCWYALLDLYQHNNWEKKLRERMQRAQRHRLLHAYPMRSGMDAYTGHPRQLLHTHRRKRNAIGIIPHTFCNTGIRGCGFCTFPHESYSKVGIHESMRAVIKEIQLRKQTSSSFVCAPLSSVYIGGGTANLSQREEWRLLLEEISTLPHSKETEFTLEGAPLYFWSNRGLLEDICSVFPEIKKRISIGVQSFQEKYISLMGRHLMNKKLLEAMTVAQELGFHISIDLLCNLPNQTTEEMLEDIRMAVSLDIPHICVYNLVCYDGLGTEWAQDPAVVSSLPSREQSMHNMECVFREMDKLGYDPITLTDFQKRGSGEAGRYRYEEDIREPEYVNWWGIGPGGISVLWDRIYGVKLENPTLSSEYVEKMQKMDSVNAASWDKSCVYVDIERKLYWLTRQIKGLTIHPTQYQRVFQSDLETDFGPILELFRKKGLLHPEYRLTQTGCYFADSMAGLLVDYALSLNTLEKTEGIGIKHNNCIPQRFKKLLVTDTKPQRHQNFQVYRRHQGNDARRYGMG